MDKARLAKQIKEMRIAAGFNQSQLAALMNTTQSAIARLEDPTKSMPTLKTLAMLSDALDCHLTVKLISPDDRRVDAMVSHAIANNTLYQPTKRVIA